MKHKYSKLGDWVISISLLMIALAILKATLESSNPDRLPKTHELFLPMPVPTPVNYLLFK